MKYNFQNLINILKSDWDQRKLKDFSYKSGKKNSKEKNFPAYSVSNKHGLMRQSDQFEDSRLESLEKSSYKIVCPNEFVYNPSRINVGSIGFNDLNRTLIVSSLYVIVKMKERVDNTYILQFMKSQNFNREVNRNTEGSVREYLFFENFKNIKFPYTKNIKEQQQVGLLLKNIDNYVALHQRSTNTLKQVRQSLIKAIIPINNRITPWVKFYNFNRNIQFYFLKDILTERRDLDPESLEYPLMSFVQGKGVTPKNDRYDRSFLVKENNKKYKKTESGDFIYSSNNLETGSIGLNTTGNAVISPVYSIFYAKNIIESKYIGFMSNNKIFINEMIRYRQGVVYGQWRIHEKDFLDIKVLIPTISEQTRVVNLLEYIDSQILLKQKKLEKLLLLKNVYLNKMFI